MWHDKTISIVLPAYNEEGNIGNAVSDFYSTGVVDEIVVVNNNSTDSTAEEVEKTPARLIHESKQGYGNALIRGLNEATGDLIIMAEPDGTFQARDVMKLLAYADDFSFVCGTRTTKELIWQGANMGWFLRIGNLIVAKMAQLLFNGPSLSDCGCTMRLIHRQDLAKFSAKLSVGGSHFLPEMVVLALENGVSLIEVPVNYRPRIGESKITGSLKGTLRTGINMILLLLAYRLRLRKVS